MLLPLQAAGHSIRAGQCYHDALRQEASSELKLNVLMEVCIDAYGYRLTAQPCMQFADEVVYGSGDAGRNVACDPKIHAQVRQAANRLHLAEHEIGESGVAVACAGDIECKFLEGSTTQAYLLDMARGMPPESPSASSHVFAIVGQPAFYKMLRPELLQRLKGDDEHAQVTDGLSPDAFTSFGSSDEAKAIRRNQDVHKATEFLLRTVIPKFVERDVMSMFHANEWTDTMMKMWGVGQWAWRLHSKGINVRYLGMIRKSIPTIAMEKNTRTGALAEVRCALLGEMAARSIKALAW